MIFQEYDEVEGVKGVENTLVKTIGGATVGLTLSKRSALVCADVCS